MDSATKPSVLFVYFTYTNQTRKVIDAMAEVLRGRGLDVTLAAIGFTDPRYAGRFQEFPMPHPFRELVGMIPAESPRRRPAKIEIPDVVTERDYDLVVLGSPTWVAVHRRPHPLLPGVRHGEPGPEREAVRRRCLLPPLLETQPQDGTQARHQARWCVR
jgi:hypothetical protein